MNIVIVGAGRVGSRLARQLDAEKHNVSIIDSNQELIDAISHTTKEFGGKTFSGFPRCGIPIDQDVLRKSNIEICDALAAVTSNDNINIMVSQLAKEVFDVPKVVARICEPRRENVFSEFELNTICPTNLSVAAAHASLIDEKKPQNLHFATNTVSFIVKDVTKDLYGKSTSNYPLKPNEHLYGVLRKNNKLEVYQGEKITVTKGDKIILSCIVD